MALRCMLFCRSLTRPEAARSAFEGTQPLFTHVPPMSWPSITATFRPCMDLSRFSSVGLLIPQACTTDGALQAWSRELTGMLMGKAWARQGGAEQCTELATHALNSMQCSSMATHATANNDEVVVIAALCLCYCGIPGNPSAALPAQRPQLSMNMYNPAVMDQAGNCKSCKEHARPYVND